MNRRPRSLRVRTVLVVLAALVIGGAGGFFWPQDDDFFALRKNFEIFGAVYEELATGYVEEIPPEDLMRAGVNAMLEDLDPYTTFINEAESADLSIITQGQYGGVGLSVARRGGRIVVTAPVEGASGYKQGVRVGDIITRIEKHSTDSLSMADVQNLLRGEPGTSVTITVERAGAPAPLEFVLKREQIDLKNVTYHGFLGDPQRGIAYMKLERFTRKAGGEMREALQTLQHRRPLQGLVLDLRDNPGGLLGAAVEVSGLFLKRNAVIVSTRGRSPESERVYRNPKSPLLPEVPLVVLVNEYSASASEIVAGAIQDHDRGIILGQRTFGKGLVQVIRELPYNSALKMTTAQYFTPSGRTIQSVNYTQADSLTRARQKEEAFATDSGRKIKSGNGIAPDVEVTAPTPSPLEQALQRRSAFFFFANHYSAKYPSVDSTFAPTDQTLEQFRIWLNEENIEYRTDAERSARKLASKLNKSGYDHTHDELNALQKALRTEKQQGFEEHAPALKAHLQREILARFLDKPTQIRLSLQRDVQTERATALLHDRSAFNDALEGR